MTFETACRAELSRIRSGPDDRERVRRDLNRLRDRVRATGASLTELCFSAGQAGDPHRARLFAGAASRTIALLDEIETLAEIVVCDDRLNWCDRPSRTGDGN